MAEDDKKDLERDEDDESEGSEPESDESPSEETEKKETAAPEASAKGPAPSSASDEEEEDEGEDEEEDASSSEEPSEEPSEREREKIAAREAKQIAREERELAAETDHDVSPVSGMLGPERWVQFSFIALAAAIFYVADRFIEFLWERVAEPDPTMVTGAAALVGLAGAFALYRHPRTNELAHEVVGELSKVTWPTRDETYYSTVVVIVTSIVAALYTGTFDVLWQALTDFVYSV